MQSVIVAWVNDPSRFEEHVPLRFIGQRNVRLNFGNDVLVIFLEGLNRLPLKYRQELEALGYTLIDAAHIYLEVDKNFLALNKFSDFEKRCFLRWLVLDKFFDGEPFIHYDGDIVLNESLKTIGMLASGLTSILYGCPAFTVISNREWLKHYEMELHLFAANVDGYSKTAWSERQGWEASFATLGAGSRFRHMITSDQDLISHLVHTKRLPQSPLIALHERFNDYLLIQNPLLFNFYAPFVPYTYRRIDEIDYFFYNRTDDPSDIVYKKRMLFWHMQSCFNFYLARAAFRAMIPGGRFTRVAYSNKEKLFDVFFNKKISRLLKHTSRLAVYKYYFQDYDFAFPMSKYGWYLPGIFN